MATVKIEVDDTELWSALWGSGYELDSVNHNWLMSTEFVDGSDWNVPGKAHLWYIPEGGDESDTKYWGDNFQEHCSMVEVTLDSITKAVSLAMRKGYRHVPCGGPIDTDTDNWDSCVGDILLQLIAYGKEVWA